MNCIEAIQHYVSKVINDPLLSGMKVLLLDSDTTRIVSMVLSQSTILEQEVFLVEPLDADHERMTHLKAAVLIRPTLHNIENLMKELKDPKYGEYHVFFSNVISKDLLQRVASCDELEVIVQVHEYYADFLACNSDLFHFNLPNSLQLSWTGSSNGNTNTTSNLNPKQTHILHRSLEGILSVLLSLKKKPVIRYQEKSKMAKKIAGDVNIAMQKDGLFDFRRPGVAPVLLILDRRDDPVTPLLSQWSYQAMVHELLGLFENRVDLRHAPGIRKDLEEIVLSVISDTFFADHKNANFGDLGMAVKKLVDEYQKKAQTHENIQSIEDMQRFVENFPAFRSQSLNVSKHVGLMGELARLVELQGLMDVSQLEQELACSDDHTNHLKELLEKLNSGKVRPMNKLRLALLYTLRYQNHGSNQIPKVKNTLRENGIPADKIDLIDSILDYGGSSVRSGDLFGDRGLKKYMRAVTQGLQGVPNVYAQHVPPLMRTLDTLIKGTLSEVAFPMLTSGGNAKEKPRDIIVFITGGVTFEEAEKVSELNEKSNSVRVLLGGSYLHNSTTFLSELQSAAQQSHSISMNSPTSGPYDSFEGDSM